VSATVDSAMIARRFYDELSIWTFEDPAADDLVPSERLVLLACGWHGPDVKAGRRRLGQMTGLATSTVEDALRRLERRGLLVRDGIGPRGVVLRRLVIPGFNADVSVSGPVEPSDVSAVGPVSVGGDVTATYRSRDGDVTVTGPVTGHEHELELEHPLSLNVSAGLEKRERLYEFKVRAA